MAACNNSKWDSKGLQKVVLGNRKMFKGFYPPYRGSTLSIPEISQALNVAHVLEGSVRKDGDRIRITAQLIEAGTDTHVWSENFDRELIGQTHCVRVRYSF